MMEKQRFLTAAAKKRKKKSAVEDLQKSVIMETDKRQVGMYGKSEKGKDGCYPKRVLEAERPVCRSV